MKIQHLVGLKFQGDDKHRTVCGGIVSLFTLTFLVLCYGLMTFEFASGSDPNLVMVEQFKNGAESIDLYRTGYRVAISKIDPHYGRIQAL